MAIAGVTALLASCPSLVPRLDDAAFPCASDTECDTAAGFRCLEVAGVGTYCARPTGVVVDDAGRPVYGDGGASGPDGGVADGGVTDGGVTDGGVTDGGVADGGVADGGVADGGADAGAPGLDAGLDAGAPDAGGLDAGVDAGPPPCPGTPPSSLCEGPGLVACYTFDEIGGQSGSFAVVDGSPMGSTAQAVNAAPTGGVQGLALSTEGTGSLRVPSSDALNPTEALTVEAFFRPSALPEGTRQGLLDKNGQWGLFLYPPDEVRCSASGVAVSATGIVAGAWTHVACVTGSVGAERALRLYLDGVLVAEATTTSGISTGTADIYAGADSPNGDQSFQGALDNVRIWSVARSDAEVCWTAQR